jgi:hypothetical protein
MAIQKGYHMQHMTIYIKYSQKGPSTSLTQTIDAIRLSSNILNIKPQGPHRLRRYQQQQHQHLHDCCGRHVRIGGIMSPRS